MPAHTLLDIPPLLPRSAPTPFRRLIMITRMFLTDCKFFTSFSTGPVFSGRRKTPMVSNLSLITWGFKLGRKKYCRSKNFPWGVRARWWNKPYTENPSLDLEEDFVGPWLWEWGCGSDCIIWREVKVSALINLYCDKWQCLSSYTRFTNKTYIVSYKLNISNVDIGNKT